MKLDTMGEPKDVLSLPMEVRGARRVSFAEDEGLSNGLEPLTAWDTARSVGGGMSFLYERMMIVMQRETRTEEEIIHLMPWFRARVGLLANLEDETLMDVLRNSHLVSAERNHIVFRQGEVGNAFFVVLQGQVSVLMKELLDDHNEFSMSDRSQLGVGVGVINAGQTFGEVALLSDDSMRTASIVADQSSDLLCIPREVYARTVARYVNAEFSAKVKFVNEHPLFRSWNPKWRRMLAICIVPKTLKYDEVLVRQGETANNMYFITSGEIKLTAEPDRHSEHFAKFMHECTSLLDENEDENLASKYFAIAKYMSAKSRRAKRLKSAPSNKQNTVESTELREYKIDMSPSSKRKMLESAKIHVPKFNICYLETGQIVGDVEFLLEFEHYHTTAICSMDASVMALNKEHFQRLFHKKNQTTVRAMLRQLALAIPKRTARSDLLKNVPLLKSIALKVQELNGERQVKRKIKDDFALPYVDCDSMHSRAKSVRSNRTFPLASNQQVVRRSGFFSDDTSAPIVMPHLPPAPNKTLQFVSQSYAPETTSAQVAESQLSLHNAHMQPRDTDRDPENASPRDGIFVKLMQLSNPGVERKHLGVSEDEYQYLVQLRRRMAKQLKDFYPYKSSETILTSRNGISDGNQRGRATPREQLPV